MVRLNVDDATRLTPAIRVLTKHPLVGVLLGVLLLALIYLVLLLPAARVEGMLADEFAQLPAPPGAQVINVHSGYKPGRATVGALYGGSLTYGALLSAYDSELGARGWRRISDSSVIFDGRDFGGRMACYLKGEYWAVLEYFGNEPGMPQGYVIDLTWGSTLCARDA